MIEGIGIRNFKAFSELRLAVRPLTILTGLNNAGKSTVIQCLLLADLAVQNTSVPLNGPNGLALGEANEVLHVGAADSNIGITILRAGREWFANLSVPDDRSVALWRVAMGDAPESPFVRSYLSAERLGPRDLLEVSASEGGLLSVGHRGEFTAHVLAQYDREHVLSGVRFPSRQEEPITVGRQTELWMQELIGAIQIQATWLPSTNAAMLRFRKPTAATDWLRPANVGFGITYALPIVVAVLTARESELIIVENPEAHLHPGGQSALGRFLGRAAAAGVQIVVETHSDHVINGIRLAVSEGAGLNPEDLMIYYFDGSGAVQSVTATAKGALSHWPRGFFDQAEKDLAVLSRVQRRG